eukprot:13060749-Alexandrium_andersonii.AAC.1
MTWTSSTWASAQALMTSPPTTCGTRRARASPPGTAISSSWALCARRPPEQGLAPLGPGHSGTRTTCTASPRTGSAWQ